MQTISKGMSEQHPLQECVVITSCCVCVRVLYSDDVGGQTRVTHRRQFTIHMYMKCCSVWPHTSLQAQCTAPPPLSLFSLLLLLPAHLTFSQRNTHMETQMDLEPLNCVPKESFKLNKEFNDWIMKARFWK